MQSNKTNHPNGNGLSEIQEKINEAELYLGQGLFEEARQIYQQILNQLVPLTKKAAIDSATRRSYESHRKFIREQLASIDRQEAEFHGQPVEDKTEESIATPETEGSAAFNRGQALLDIGLFAEAVQEFQRAAQQGFRLIECSLQMGKAYIQLGQYRQGIQVLEKAYKSKGLSETDRDLLLGQMAVAYETAGEKDKALKLYQRLAVSDPKHLTAASKVKSLGKETDRYHLNMVKLHLKNEQFDKATKTLLLMQREHQVPVDQLMTMYEQLLQKDPGNAEAREQITAVYQEMIDTGSADAEIRLKLARHLLSGGQFDAAASEYLEVMLEDTPHKITALNELAKALLNRQDYDRILELLGDARSWVESLKPGPEMLNYYYLLARAYEQKGETNQARTYFQRAAAIDPTHEAIRLKVDTQAPGPLRSQGKALLRLNVDEKIQYQIRRTIGQDEISQLFEVSEIPTGTVRAAKTLLPHFSGGPKAKNFIVKWSHEQASMENRNITRVLDVAESQGKYYLIMENLDKTLDDLLEEKTKLPLDESIRLARALLNALAYAHSHRGTDDTLRKIFHLALNPRRVYISGSVTTAKITDFGLISQMSSILDITRDFTEISAFELAYMSPELFNRSPGKMPDKMKQAADLYSFGLVFYKALTGKIPFEGPSPEDFKKQHNEQYPVPPRVFISTIPAKLDEAILKCLHKDPKKRWRTPTELDLALEKIQI